MSSSDSSTRILAIDVGGTGLKAALLDGDGNLVAEPGRIPTPHPCLPDDLVNGIAEAAKGFEGKYTAVSVGFPGILRHGKIETAPTLASPELIGFDFVEALTKRLGRPVRALNDASMQGFGSIKGSGVEMIITLGTGMGSAIFRDGALAVQLELSTHQFRKCETYNEQLGVAALEAVGKKKWNKRVEKAIENLRNLVRFDHLYIGGGNAKKISFPLPNDVTTVPNENGLKGGAQLWRQTAGSTANTSLDAAPGLPAPAKKVVKKPAATRLRE